MAFTRFYDDPDRIMKKLQESTDQGMYYLNCPGNGEKPPYVADPNIILQKWGANLHENRIEVESELFRIREPLKRDCERKNIHLLRLVIQVLQRNCVVNHEALCLHGQHVTWNKITDTFYHWILKNM